MPSQGIADLWVRIKSHKVVQWTLAYLAFGFAVVHGVQLLREAFEWPALVSRFVVTAIIVGIPVAATVAWYHGHRARHRVSGSELGILIALLLAAGSVLWFLSRVDHEHAAPPASTASAAGIARPVASTTTAFAPPPHSVAVLPFTNLSGDAKQEYFSDGISEELINAISQVEDLEVAARTSSFSFKSQNVDIGTIARKLNVAAVLEGSIRRSGDTVRITVQLINAVNGFHIWSQNYDRALKDILAVQTEVAAAVAQQLQVKLLGDEAAKIEAGGTRSAEAYDAYLRGRELMSRAESEAEYRAALGAFDQAVALDPKYAAAYVKQANLLIDIAVGTNDAPVRKSLREAARKAAERAVALAPDLADAHLSLGFVRQIGYLDFAGGAPELERALALAPGSAEVQAYFGASASLLGHHEAALAALRRAIRLDPQNYRLRIDLAQGLYRARRFAEVLVVAQDARAIKPEGHVVPGLTYLSYLALKQTELARRMCESPSTPLEEDDRHYCLALVYHALGRSREADAERQKWHDLDGDSTALEYAALYAQWGDKASALRWLETAERLRDPALQLLRVEWRLDPIRDEPAFKALERRMNFPP